jgi:NAD(P)-dependent dehydrogenase (short-subunit alcohol dehydrogenase family)
MTEDSGLFVIVSGQSFIRIHQIYSPMGALQKRTTIITGAGSGMGKAMALLFAAEGANVVAADIRQQDLAAVVNAIRLAGGEATGILCDVGSEDDVRILVEGAVAAYGSVDVLVNNAGVMDDFLPVEHVSNEVWNRVLRINVNGPFFACREVVPRMLKQGKGVIINIASVGGLEGGRAGVTYTTSKHALIGMTKNIGYVYAQKGIRCNAIAPGGVNTNIGRDMKPDPFGYERSLPGMGTMPRMGEPEEIARTALFLASDAASFINGAVVTADGGWTAY